MEKQKESGIENTFLWGMYWKINLIKRNGGHKKIGSQRPDLMIKNINVLTVQHKRHNEHQQIFSFCLF
jgi:hypothetical protein